MGGIIGGSVAYLDASNPEVKGKDVHIEDVVPLPLGIEECDENDRCGLMKAVIKKNTPYPTSSDLTMCQQPETATTHWLALFEGEAELIANNFKLGEVTIHEIPARNKYVCDNVVLSFVVDKDGIVNIKAHTNETYGEVKTYQTKIDFETKLPSDAQKSHNQKTREAMAQWYDFKKHPALESVLIQDTPCVD